MILLAFVAQKLVTSSSQPAEQPTFTGFQKELTEGKVSRVTMQTKNQELEVTLKDGKTYVTGYPDNYGAEVTTAIDEAKVPFVVEGKGGSAWFGKVGGLRALAGLCTGSLENLSGWRSMSRARAALATTQCPRSPVV